MTEVSWLHDKNAASGKSNLSKIAQSQIPRPRCSSSSRASFRSTNRDRLGIEAIQNTLSLRKVRVAKSGVLFDRPEACHPVEYDAKREAEITHLNVVLRLLCVGEQACGERAHLRQGGDLIGQLMHRDM